MLKENIKRATCVSDLIIRIKIALKEAYIKHKIS